MSGSGKGILGMVRSSQNEVRAGTFPDSWHVLSARFNFTEATAQRQAVMTEIEQFYPEQLLVHYNDIILLKDD